MTAKAQTTMRLSEEAAKVIAEIRKRHGFTSDAAAVEYLAAYWKDTHYRAGKSRSI